MLRIWYTSWGLTAPDVSALTVNSIHLFRIEYSPET
jgi:hypothetical protein